MNNDWITKILPFLNMNTVWGGLKLVFMMAFGIYVVFSFVVVSQINQMTKTLNGTMEWPIKILGFVHLGIAVGALVLAFFVL